MTNSQSLRLAVLATTCLVVPSLASAQQQPTERDIERQKLEQPGPFDPLGIRSGSFFFFPKIELAGNYDDNVFATSGNEEDDFFFTASPRIDVKSNLSRHAVNFTIGAEFGLYDEFTDNNYQDFDVGVDAALDISRSDLLKSKLAFARKHEDRDSPDDFGADEPIVYYEFGPDISYRHDFNRIFTVASIKAVRLEFEDTNVSNEDDRDRYEIVPGLRLGYQLSPRFSPFIQGNYVITKYDQTPDDANENRDGTGYSVRAGTTIDFTRLLVGELSAGYVFREYDDNNLDDVKGFGGGGTLTWTPTQLTTVNFRAVGEVQETTVTFQGDPASADFAKTIGVDLTHELRRNLFLKGGASYTRDDFEGTDRSDNSVRANVGLTYQITRNFGIDATYEFTDRTSDDDNEEFTRNIFRIGVTARL